MTERLPNVLWIQTDEHRADSLGCYGSPWAKTPRLDALARRGVTFERCFCPAPVCAPSRCSQLACRYPQELNVLMNPPAGMPDVFEPGTVAFPEVFASAGYRTVNFGKTHTPVHPVWQSTDDFTFSFDVSGFIELAQGRDPAQYNVLQRPGEVPLIIGGTWPEPGNNQSRIVTDRALALLNDHGEDDAPFLLRVSHLWPHTPVLVPPPFDTIYDADEVPVRPFDAEAYTGRSGYDRAMGEIHRMWELSEKAYRQNWVDYMALVSYVDHEVGRLLDGLAETGLERDTIVVFSADHGRMLGEFGTGEKDVFDDASFRVPMIWSWPGVLDEGRREAGLANLIDTGPTLLGLAGLADHAPNTWHGRDLFSDPAPDAVFSQIGWPRGDSPLLQRDGIYQLWEETSHFPWADSMRVAVRTDRYRMDVTRWRAGQHLTSAHDMDGNLIDLEQDPRERVNRWHDPAFSNVRDRLIERIEQWETTLAAPEATFASAKA